MIAGSGAEASLPFLLQFEKSEKEEKQGKAR
jgi:hypothetical protein